MVTIKGVEFPEPDPGSYHNFSITLEHGPESSEDTSRVAAHTVFTAISRGLAMEHRTRVSLSSLRGS